MIGFIDNFNIHDLAKMPQQLKASIKGMLVEVLLLGKILKLVLAIKAVSENLSLL